MDALSRTLSLQRLPYEQPPLRLSLAKVTGLGWKAFTVGMDYSLGEIVS